MKKLLKVSLLLIITLFVFNACSDDDDSDDFIVAYESLPAASQTFVATHFKDVAVSLVKERYVAESDGTYYSVYLAGGYEIDFKKSGEWVSVDHPTTELPQSVVKLLPAITQEYLTTNFATAKVLEIEKLISGGYEVELNNDIDLIFDSTGKFIALKK